MHPEDVEDDSFKIQELLHKSKWLFEQTPSPPPHIFPVREEELPPDGDKIDVCCLPVCKSALWAFFFFVRKNLHQIKGWLDCQRSLITASTIGKLSFSFSKNNANSFRGKVVLPLESKQETFADLFPTGQCFHHLIGAKVWPCELFQFLPTSLFIFVQS